MPDAVRCLAGVRIGGADARGPARGRGVVDVVGRLVDQHVVGVRDAVIVLATWGAQDRACCSRGSATPVTNETSAAEPMIPAMTLRVDGLAVCTRASAAAGGANIMIPSVDILATEIEELM